MRETFEYETHDMLSPLAMNALGAQGWELVAIIPTFKVLHGQRVFNTEGKMITYWKRKTTHV